MQSSDDGDDLRRDGEAPPRGRGRERATSREALPTVHGRLGLLSSIATVAVAGVAVLVVVGVVLTFSAASRILNSNTPPEDGEEEADISDADARLGPRTALRKHRRSRGARDHGDDADDKDECGAVAAVRREEQKRWYRLPPRGSRAVDGADAGAGGDDDDDGSSSSSGVSPCMADGRCVCCFERAPRFMFLACLHVCLCEPCLIRLGRTYEDATLRGRFLGPVQLPCPLCREVGPVVQSFVS